MVHNGGKVGTDSFFPWISSISQCMEIVFGVANAIQDPVGYSYHHVVDY
jgi:hypothetical protein